VSDELQDIMASIATIQEAITPPTGQNAAKATDEPPVSIGTFPMFVNLEESSTPEPAAGGGPRINRHVIGMNLVFQPADTKYAVRQRRPWYELVLDAFDTSANQLIGGHANGSQIIGVEYDAFAWNGQDYPCITFMLEVVGYK